MRRSIIPEKMPIIDGTNTSLDRETLEKVVITALNLITMSTGETIIRRTSNSSMDTKVHNLCQHDVTFQ